MLILKQVSVLFKVCISWLLFFFKSNEMQKIILFSVCLITGLIFSQLAPAFTGSLYLPIREGIGLILSVALSYIMINVGREFHLDKKRWRTYSLDYYVAMMTAALPWISVALYFMFLLPDAYFSNWNAWKESLLLSRFAAPTSAGILFTMLAAVGLKTSWVYGKIQTLAIFDDLDTILLMIPLKILMVGMHWEVHIILFVVVVLLVLGWKKLDTYTLPQRWYHIVLYALAVVFFSEFIYYSSMLIFERGVHLEVLLPAFVLGMIMKNEPIEDKLDAKVSTGISYVFMFLVGLSMPLFIGQLSNGSETSLINHPVMSWGEIAWHVLIVTFLSNVGKLYPILHYRDRRFSERLAISIGMFTRGEVGAGIIFIAIGYNIGGPLLAISVLSLVTNLILTGFFIGIVRKLVLRPVVIK